jgi:hypothetical protein
MPRHSVIVPTKDRPEMLARALASVQAQTVDDWEVIVVNDGGQPPELPDDPRMSLIDLPTSCGHPHARNLAAPLGTGTYISQLDDDDWWLPERLALADDGLRDAPIALCWFRYEDEPDHGRILDGDVTDVVLDGTIPSLGATTIERACWQPLDETYKASADLEWWLRIAPTLTVRTVPRTGLIVGRHSGARVGYGTEVRLQHSRRLLTEHADYFATHPSAAAFRWRRIAVMARQTGRRGLAVRAGLKALHLHPSAATARTLLASVRP